MNNKARILWAVVAIVIGLGLVVFLRLSGTNGLYISTGLNNTDPKTTVQSCADICTNSCLDFSGDENTTCQADCRNLCTENY